MSNIRVEPPVRRGDKGVRTFKHGVTDLDWVEKTGEPTRAEAYRGYSFIQLKCLGEGIGSWSDDGETERFYEFAKGSPLYTGDMLKELAAFLTTIADGFEDGREIYDNIDLLMGRVDSQDDT